MNIEKKQFYKDLVELGKSKGSLSNREIMDAIDEVALDAEHMEKLYDMLEEQGIEIIEDAIDDIENLDLADVTNATYQTDDGTELMIVDDPVKVYLKEIGKVPLLTADEEIGLAKRMSDGNQYAKDRLAAWSYLLPKDMSGAACIFSI